MNDSSSSEYDSQDEQSSKFYESSDSYEDDDSENLADDDDSQRTREWNYRIPKRNLKVFNDKSNISHKSDFKFRPIDAFMMLFTQQLFELIWEQTNVYGQQKHGTNWIPVTISEIISWIGLNTLMGYHKLPSYRDYWSSNSNFNVPIVCQSMSRNTYTKILSNIHLADNTNIPPKTSSKYSKTYKVDEFLNILLKNFKKNYNLCENVSIDESMIKFKGRSSLKQYLPLKPTKRGFKV